MNEIPKVIHYFWFGGSPIPDKVRECIQSWKKFCPDYEIKRWDEKNFQINRAPLYVKEAYKAKKWAFVSDYARLYVLNKYGGVYLDTDVKLIKGLDKIIEKGSFLACESLYPIKVNPGLGMATYSNNDLIKDILEEYKAESFILKNNQYNKKNIVTRFTGRLIKDGLQDVNKVQDIDGFNIYPVEYFCPLNFETGQLKVTSNTVGIHLYLGSWLTDKDRYGQLLRRKMIKIFGVKIGIIISDIYIKPRNLREKIKGIGFKKATSYYLKKYLFNDRH